MRSLGFVSCLIFSASALEHELIGEEGFYRYTSGYMEDRGRNATMMRGEQFFIDKTGTVTAGSPFHQENDMTDRVLNYPRGFVLRKGNLVEQNPLRPEGALLLVHNRCTIQYPWWHRTHFNVICGPPLKGMRIRFRVGTGTTPDLSKYGFEREDLQYFPRLEREHEKRLSGFILNAAARLRDEKLVVADVMRENRKGFVNHVVWPLPGGRLMFWVQDPETNSIKAMIYGATSRGLQVAKTFGTASSSPELFVTPEGALKKASKYSYYFTSWDPAYKGLAAFMKQKPLADKDLVLNGIMQRVVKALITAVDKGFVPSQLTLMNFFIRFKPGAQVAVPVGADAAEDNLGFEADDLRIVGLDRGVNVAAFNQNISNRYLKRLAATNIDRAVFEMVLEAYRLAGLQIAKADFNEMKEIIETKSAGRPFVKTMSRLCLFCRKLRVLAKDFGSGEACCSEGQGLLRLLPSQD